MLSTWTHLNLTELYHVDAGCRISPAAWCRARPDQLAPDVSATSTFTGTWKGRSMSEDLHVVAHDPTVKPIRARYSTDQ